MDFSLFLLTSISPGSPLRDAVTITPLYWGCSLHRQLGQLSPQTWGSLRGGL